MTSFKVGDAVYAITDVTGRMLKLSHSPDKIYFALGERCRITLARQHFAHFDLRVENDFCSWNVRSDWFSATPTAPLDKSPFMAGLAKVKAR